MIQEHVNVVTVEGPGKGKYVCYTAMQLHRFGMTLHVLCIVSPGSSAMPLPL